MRDRLLGMRSTRQGSESTGPCAFVKNEGVRTGVCSCGAIVVTEWITTTAGTWLGKCALCGAMVEEGQS